MGIRREEEMEMSDDDMEDAPESKDSDDSGTHSPLTHHPLPSSSGDLLDAHFSAFSACSLKLCLIKCEKYGVGNLFSAFFCAALISLSANYQILPQCESQ